MKKTLIVLIASFLLTLTVGANYYTLEGPHFFVHFPEGYEDLASKLMVQAEEIMAELGEKMNLTINDKGHFVIEDPIDLSNGYATNTFYPLIAFYPVFPGDPLLGGLGPDIDDWFETLLWHEGTHLYHVEMTKFPNQYITKIFGRYPTFYPIWSSPLSNIEGFAVYNETHYQRVGRGSGSIYPMILDAAIDAGDLPDPKSTLGTYDLDRYDLAGLPYIYGWNFLEFLADTYGENAPLMLQDYYVNTPGKAFMAQFDVALQKLTGKTFGTLSSEWYKWMKENYDAPPLNPEGRIYDNLGDTIFPGFFDGEFFYYAMRGGSSGIYRIELKTGREELVKYVPYIYGSISKDPSGGILYSSLDIDAQGNQYFNIYRYANRKTEAVVIGERAFSPVATKTGLYYLSQKHPEGNALYKRDLDGYITLLYLSKPGEEILQFAVSSKDEIYVSLWQEGGFVDLGLLEDGKITFLTSDHYADSFPALSKDETKLYFQSNRTGCYGIWVLDLQTMQIAPVATNHYGAFKPTPSLDTENRVAFVSYTNDGLRLAIHEFSGAASWQQLTIESPPERKQYPSLDELLTQDGYSLKKYRSSSYAKPTMWLPSFVGALVLGTDPLQNYVYTALYNYNPFAEQGVSRHEFAAAVDLIVNPLHVVSLSVESNFKKTYFSTIYSGTVPLGSNALLLSGSANTIGDFATEVRLQLPWGTKAATGTSFIFGKASVELWQKTLDNYEFNLGYSHKLQASHDVNFELSFSYNFNHDGYVTETNTYLGEHIAFSEYAMNWVFARPLWSVGASSTVWSEKMTLSPKFAFMLGDKNWDLSFGLQFTNTISLTYGRLPIDLGLKVMYYMGSNKLIVSPVIRL